jgi:hypothetical protein
MRLRSTVSVIALLLFRATSAAAEETPQEQRAVHTPPPMSIAALPESLDRFLRQFDKEDFLTFPEHRENPIQLFDGIPEVWTRRRPGDLNRFEATAQPGEYFVFQIGVYAHQKELRDLDVKWTDMRGASTIAAKEMTCFNTSGINFRGERFNKRIDIRKGRVQPLWFGVQIPPGANGRFQAQLTVSAAKVKPATVGVLLNVSGGRVANHGFDRGKSLSRLAWLNTRLGEDSAVTRGYEPVRRTGNELKILGRTVALGPHGLPHQIKSFFEPSNQFLLSQGEPLLTDEIRFLIEKDDGNALELQPGTIRWAGENPSSVSWNVASGSPECDLLLSGRMEFDGFIDYRLTLKAKREISVRDIRLEIPMQREKAEYMMGLNHEGGIRRGAWSWKWDTTKDQDMLWVGAVNGGVRVKLKAENHVRPLINIYYAYGPLRLPPSWGNGGKGGVNVTEQGGDVLISAYSGSRKLVPGEALHYDFELLVTPFRTIEKKIRFGDRYFHGGGTSTAAKIAMADSVGANIINIHHAEDIYPFINYPYLDENVPALRSLVEKAHAQGKRLKVYYTTRELTKNLPEFWPLCSLNGEVIYPGPGNECKTIINPHGPDEWLKKNLKENYIPAWLNLIKEGPFAGEVDLAVITTPDSRLNNFYIGGLDWMLAHLGIDGVYIDDSALDRLTVRRARKLIDRYRPEGRIDFHTWNHFNDMAGWTNCLNLYMDLLPYFDLVWVGEGRDYDRMPDHWLIEVSGIPFGLTGQMLHGGGNLWRGMVYAITNRPGWAGDPSHLWKFWDSCRIAEKQMIGYWDRNTPVTCTNDSLKVTLFRGSEESILALANWGSGPQKGSVRVNWGVLGYDPSSCGISIPSIPEFQEGGTLGSLDRITVPGKKGYLIMLRQGGARR